MLWSFCLWTSVSIKYVFYNDFLLVKGGQISREILYDEITQISSANDMYTGYRILSSKGIV
ncbi:PH domain-containing protein [Cytobacillus oceanisediminis]|uniref:PH domain-containing protein n=1 Tax=Cytobacillus oceanisediminis TaxID=665099 RepID=UPI0015E84B5B